MLTSYDHFRTFMACENLSNNRILPPEVVRVIGQHFEYINFDRTALINDIQAYICLLILFDKRLTRHWANGDVARNEEIAPLEDELKIIPTGNINELHRIQKLSDNNWKKQADDKDSIFKTYSATLLGDAAEEGNLGLVTVYINRGAYVDGHNHRYQSALMKAASHGHVEIVKSLLKAKANYKLEDFEGKTAKDYARENGQVAVVTVLEEISVNKCTVM